MTSLVVSHIVKKYSASRGSHPVLRDLSFNVSKGEILCILGPNGSGKTTLLKTIATLLFPTEGNILWGNINLHKNTTKAKRILGFASTEDQSFYGRMSARLNLWFYAQMYGLSKETYKKRILLLAEQLELHSFLDKPFRELSSGQKQRMLLARAVIHSPELLLLDEPHQNLDPRFSSRLRSILKNQWCAQEGKTILVSTHHLEDAEKISDRWVVLSEGKVRFSGSIKDEKEKNPHFRLETFFEELTRPEKGFSFIKKT